MTETHAVDARTDRSHWLQADRLAATTFGVAMAAAFVMYLVLAHRNWFFLDEWDFLASRRLGSLHDLMAPHNEHWSTLPIIVYRVLWRFFGLRTYMPYVSCVVVLHCTAALLLRVVMRRAGVHPWLATAGAGMFLFLGAGFQNIIWAFQIGFVGSLVFGLGQLLLADHEGGFDRRDVLALLCGLAALMCSGVGVTLVVVSGLAVLVRRGWKLALIQTAPLGLAFVGWWLTWGQDSYADSVRPSIGTLLDFMWSGIWNALTELAVYPVVAVLLLAVLVFGAVLSIVDRRRARLRIAAAPWALLAGAFLFMAITGMGRAGSLGADFAKPSRYVHLVSAMMLPAIATAAQAIFRRWAVTLPFLAVLLAFGIPGNIADLTGTETFEQRLLHGNPDLVETYPTVDYASEVPGRTQPDRVLMDGATIEWLRDGQASGDIPRPEVTNRRLVDIARVRLALEQIRDESRPTACVPLRTSTRLDLRKGDRIRIVGGDVVVQLVEDDRKKARVLFSRLRNSALVARTDHLVVVVGPSTPRAVLRCR